MTESTSHDGEHAGGVHGKNGAKPVFFVQSAGPTSAQTLSTEDVYRSVAEVIDPGDIQGIQRVGKLWRIYPHSVEDQATLLTSGISLKGKQINLQAANPFTRVYEGTKLTIHGIPLSASDTVITTALKMHDCVLTCEIERQLLRVDGQLTSCQTGARAVYVKLPEQPLPRSMEMGRYRGTVYHTGQVVAPRESQNYMTCRKCLLPGHIAAFCKNDWVCSLCRMPGHKRNECGRLTPAKPYNADSDDPDITDDNTSVVGHTADNAVLPQEGIAADQTQDTATETTTPTTTTDGATSKTSTAGQKNQPDKVQKERRAKTKKKKAKKTAPPSDTQKITEFISSCRSQAEGAASAQTPRGQERKSKNVRTPPTPAEDMNDDSKRLKHEGANDDDDDNDTETDSDENTDSQSG